MQDTPAHAHTTTDAPRWPSLVVPIVIVLAAIGYYGSYLRYWFNPHDEGGTAALTAMRLLAGEAPLRDIEMGYNVGWFWPIAGLFKMFGVNFVLMRAYFFALSTITALCGWAVTRRLTRNEWLATLVGLFLVVFPGSQFKNYIPMFGVANTLCLVLAAADTEASLKRFSGRAFVGGIVLGLTFLARIDLGYLFTLLWLGVIALRMFDTRLTFISRLGHLVVVPAILATTWVATQGPMDLLAKKGGYQTEFREQYRSWANYLTGQAGALVGQGGSSSATPEGIAEAALSPEKKARLQARKIDRTTMPRMDWKTASASGEFDKKVLFGLTYAPLPMYALLLGIAAASVIAAIFRREFALDQPATLALIALIGSLATFPQFFVFRPDRPHLTEFMPGYVVAAVSAVALLGVRWRWILGGLLAAQLGLFGWLAMDHYSAGTIAAKLKIKKNKRVFFDGSNGVRVWVHQRDFEEFGKVRKAVEAHSKPGEWLVCYPYQPGYNVMTNRPTYEKELYQDNATAALGWDRAAIARIDEKKPAVVIIDDRPINKVEASRFSVWAKPVYRHLQATYQVVEKIGTIEVFARQTTHALAPAPASATTTAPSNP